MGVLSHIKYKIVKKKYRQPNKSPLHCASPQCLTVILLSLFFSRIWQIQTNSCKGILQSAFVGIASCIFEDIYKNVDYLHGKVSRFEIFGAKKTISIGLIKSFAMLAKTFCH